MVPEENHSHLEEILDRERCTKQFVLNVSKNAKFHSSQQKASQFTVEVVMLVEKDHLDSRHSFFIFLYFPKPLKTKSLSFSLTEVLP